MQSNGHHEIPKLQAALEELTLDDYADFCDKILVNTWQEWVFIGSLNYNIAEIMVKHVALEMKKLRKNSTVMDKSKIPPINIIHVPDNARIVLEKELENLGKKEVKLSTLDKTFMFGHSTP
jgi:secreted Zn-dependent insulinase-like peptidase